MQPCRPAIVRIGRESALLKKMQPYICDPCHHVIESQSLRHEDAHVYPQADYNCREGDQAGIQVPLPVSLPARRLAEVEVHLCCRPARLGFRRIGYTMLSPAAKNKSSRSICGD
jgi:hypothetical protein